MRFLFLAAIPVSAFAVMASLAQSEIDGRLRCEAIHSAAVCQQQIAR